MIIDLILDRKDGSPYRAHDFYFDCLAYGSVGNSITAAMDYGTEWDVRRALDDYIMRNEYNPAIIDYIHSVRWLDD